MKKVRLKNLRVDGVRISLPTFKAVAEKLLPGPDATPNEQRKGKKTKLTIARELSAVDPEFRKRFKHTAREVLAGPVKRAAADFGYNADATTGIEPTDSEVIELDQYFGALSKWAAGPANTESPNPPNWATDEHFRACWAPTIKREREEMEKHGRSLTADERKAHGTFDDSLRGPDCPLTPA